MTRAASRGVAEPETIEHHGERARLASWRADGQVAHLSPTAMRPLSAASIDSCLERLRARGFTFVVTSALTGVESAGFLRWIPRSPLTLLDFGSGGGLPGMLIAILRDECRVLLLEARERKGVFLRHAVRSLSLGNVTVEGSLSIPRRARPSAFDRVVVRAVGDIVGVGDAAAAHLAPGGLLIAAKGSRAIEETEAAERKKRLRGLAWIEHRIDPLTTKDGRLIGGSTLVFRRSPE